jgi:hypothetical protein
MRRRLATVINDKKLGRMLKERKNHILKSILSELNGLLIIHQVDKNEQRLNALYELQT